MWHWEPPLKAIVTVFGRHNKKQREVANIDGDAMSYLALFKGILMF